MSDAEFAPLYAREARRVEALGLTAAAAFWWTQALVLALVNGDRELEATARERLRAAGCLD